MDATFFLNNREKLMSCIDGGVAVFSAHSQMQAANDIAAPFTQESNFYYLTGIALPNWQLVIDGSKGKSWLIAPQLDATQVVFDGSLTWEDASKLSGIAEIISPNEGTAIIKDLSNRHSMVYALGDDPSGKYYNFVQNPAVMNLWRRLSGQFKEVRDCRQALAQLRAIKQPAEIRLLKQAVHLTVDAFTAVKEQIHTKSFEYEIEAEFSHFFRKKGALGHAYEPIIGSGANACTLHYTANNDRIKKRGLVLMDVGALVAHYPADVSRTYAIGNATARQAAVHAAVASVHEQTITMLRPGLSFRTYAAAVDASMRDALVRLGLLSAEADLSDLRRYFPHAISHGLGLDVHDSLGGFREFQPGMTLTVEPGIYIPEEGIGVRIEDDILITEKGNINLSGQLSTDL